MGEFALQSQLHRQVLFKGTAYGNFSDRLQVNKTSNDLKQGCPVLLLEGHYLEQGSSNLSLEVQSAAEFSSNPDQTHLPVIF